MHVHLGSQIETSWSWNTGVISFFGDLQVFVPLRPVTVPHMTSGKLRGVSGSIAVGRDKKCSGHRPWFRICMFVLNWYMSFYLEFPMHIKTLFFCIHLSRAWLERIPPQHSTEVSTCGSVWWSLKEQLLSVPPWLGASTWLAPPPWLGSTWWSLQPPRRCTDTLAAHISSPVKVCLATTTTTMSSHSRSGKMWKM